MKKRLLSILLAIVLALAALPSSALAASVSYGSIPIYLGYSDVDYMAEELLDAIPTKGKNARDQILAVYNWVAAVRSGEAALPQFDAAAVAEKSGGTFYRQITSAVNHGRLVFRTDYDATPLSPDSNQHIAVLARKLMLERTGDCAHYTALLAVLLSHLGYDCRVISGSGADSGRRWNYVLADDQYYWLDMCGTAHLSDGSSWAKTHQWDNTYSSRLAANASAVAEQYCYNAAFSSGIPWLRCSSWAEDYMQQAYRLSLIPERLKYRDLTDDITRSEFASVALALYEMLTDTAVPDYVGEMPFTDTTDADVLKAYGLGIVKGIGSHQYAPDDFLTREQAMTMLGRVYELVTDGAISNGSSLPQDDLASFSDRDSVSAFARNYVCFFVSAGWVNGVGNNSLAPKINMTRESALKLAAVWGEQLASSETE